MNAVDITARALAVRAGEAEAALASPTGAGSIGTANGTSLQAVIDQTDEGTVSIGARAAPTAAELEALSAQFGALTGYAGTTHTVETAAYMTRDRLVIRGNGAELRNIDPTPLTGVGDPTQAALPVGVSNVWLTDSLTYYAVLATAGTELTIAPEGSGKFVAGDLVIVHGETRYFVPGDEYNIYRNALRARVVSASATTVTLDRMLPSELLADGPVIGNVAEGISAGFEGPPQFYLLYAPHVSNLVLTSDIGGTLQWGGVIDGTFRDLTLVGRNAVGLNAMQDCLLENIHFQAWRKICELAEGSYGTTVRTLRGSLSDASTRRNGSSDVPTFFISIGENCAECVLDDLNVNSGPNDTTYNACQIGAGRHNEIRNSILRFPANTGPALAIQSNPAAGHGVLDSGYRNVTVYAPVCSRFFVVNDTGGGITRAYFHDCRFYGSPAVSAGLIMGDEGSLKRVWCERGALAFGGTPANWTIRDCYFPDGFAGLTDALMAANDIAENDSDANRRLRQAAKIVVGNTVQIAQTSANNVYQSATFAAGDLAVDDQVCVYTEASAGGAGGTNRQGRLSVTVNGVTTGLGSILRTTNGAAMGFDAQITVLADNGAVAVLGYRIKAGGNSFEGVANVGSLTANDLTFNMEYWCSNASDPVNARVCRIVAVKPGMKHLPLR
uniref:hypothetical protein n=1 Tax=Altererythrobacter segetis TaxID=1104773 RepID=UPI001408D5A5|nr:hypothetical protein [Altererythrobacter segetis]